AIRDRIQLVIPPAMFLFLLLTVGAVYFYSEFDGTTADILSTDKLIGQFRSHINVTMWSTLLVVGTAIPLGIALTRDQFRKFAPTVVGFANSGQAIPAYGLIIIFFTIMGRGTITAIVALTVFAIIPVLRNTMVGLDQVDKPTIEAARGMGMSKREVLQRIELPLAVPVILAGVRTALVINVGMAALVFLIGAGGLGETINSGLKLQRNTAIFVGAALVALLALAIDFIASLAERYLKPKGI
ncbi:MAG: ABC transporter permease, partial [Acidimicrobiia bacterium]